MEKQIQDVKKLRTLIIDMVNHLLDILSNFAESKGLTPVAAFFNSKAVRRIAPPAVVISARVTALVGLLAVGTMAGKRKEEEE